jgi:hypothetical protein
MKTNAKYKENSPKLEDGAYSGVWGGYVAKVIKGDKLYIFETETGIRTPSVTCSVFVSGEMITVTC